MTYYLLTPDYVQIQDSPLTLTEEYSEPSKTSQKMTLHKAASNSLSPAASQKDTLCKARLCSKHSSSTTTTKKKTIDSKTT